MRRLVARPHMRDVTEEELQGLMQMALASAALCAGLDASRTGADGLAVRKLGALNEAVLQIQIVLRFFLPP
jgi:hypothetical protein